MQPGAIYYLYCYCYYHDTTNITTTSTTYTAQHNAAHTSDTTHLEHVDVGDDVEGQRVREDLVRRHLARRDVLLSLVQELVHAGGARTGGRLYSFMVVRFGPGQVGWEWEWDVMSFGLVSFGLVLI